MRRRLRVQLEMGGKNPTVVLADADLDRAVENTDQRRLRVDGAEVHGHQPRHRRGAVYDAFVERLVARTRALRVGNGMDPSTDVGPAIDQAQLDTVLRYIETGRAEGARLAAAAAG